MSFDKKLREIFPGVYKLNGRLCTKSLAPGTRVYGEDVINSGSVEYRVWDLHRSKLGGAIAKGLKEMPIAPGSQVLYLGAASGTTPSHVADIVGEEGIVFCVEFSHRTLRDLVKVCEERPNMIPLLGDARFPEKYTEAIEQEAGGKVEVVYQDVADPEQERILEVNCEKFLPKGGSAMLCVKARSIDATAPPEQVFSQVKKRLEKSFELLQQLDLTPYDKDHLFLNLKKK